ncbi:hypothetical protein ACFLT1_09680 [Bacteroidota bacterium]
METFKFAHLETPILKKRMLTYNLVSVISLVITIGGAALFTIDQEKYKTVFYTAIGVNIIIMASLRNAAISMKKELKRREG